MSRKVENLRIIRLTYSYTQMMPIRSLNLMLQTFFNLFNVKTTILLLKLESNSAFLKVKSSATKIKLIIILPVYY